MKRNSFLLLILSFCLLAISGCAPVPTQAASTPPPLPVEPTSEPVAAIPVAANPSPLPPGPTPEPVLASPVVLTIEGVEETLTFTMEELQALPATSGQAGMKSSTGKITVPALYKGVLLTDLVSLVGGLTSDFGVNVVANDGYAMTLSYDQIMSGNFFAYDPSDGSEKQIDDPLMALVAYEVDGKPLDSRSDGVLRLVIISERNNQVTDGHWSIKWVERIEVQPLVREWSLSLEGVRQEVIDRNTYQSCGATSCHQSTWTDDRGQVWAGVPLYLLAGRVDDDISHEGPAYNRDLANAGYAIELTATDGYTVSIKSAAAFYNRQILVAYLVNDSPLPDQYFPLRLVGEDLEKDQRAGSLAKIRLIMEAAGEIATAEAIQEPVAPVTDEEPPVGTTLWITGQVTNPLALNDAALRVLQIAKITAEHPKKGSEEYEGIYLNALLDLAGPQAGASVLVLTAADGYSASVDLAAVQNCADCLLAFTEAEGAYKLAMPSFESSAWLKDLVKIEVQ